MLIKLPKFAQEYGISRQTALSWFHQGKLPYPAKKISDRIILVEVPDNFPYDLKNDSPSHSGKTVAYMRVSTQSQKEGLTLQKMAILEYANDNNIKIDKFVEEIGSGYNGNRKKLQRILENDEYSTIIVEHKDRIIRTNFPILNAALQGAHRQVLVVNDHETGNDLVAEVTEFMVSACGRLYGKRGAERVKKALVREEELRNE